MLQKQMGKKWKWRETFIKHTHVCEDILYDPSRHCYSYAEIHLKSKSKVSVPFLFQSYTFLLSCKCIHLFLPGRFFLLSGSRFTSLATVPFKLKCSEPSLFPPGLSTAACSTVEDYLLMIWCLLFSMPITHHSLPFLASVTFRYFPAYVFWYIPSWLSSSAHHMNTLLVSVW